MIRAHRLDAKDLARIAVFAALIAALGLPGTLTPFGASVPITAQTLGVMLAGAVLGARRGFLAVLVFLVLVLAGLPLLAGGRGGLGVLTGPSAGYLLAFPVGAFVVGWLVQRRVPNPPTWWVFFASVAGGIIVVYAAGIPVQAWRTGTSSLFAALTGAAIFLPGDLIKAAVCAGVATGVHRAYPVLTDEPRLRRDPARSGQDA